MQETFWMNAAMPGSIFFLWLQFKFSSLDFFNLQLFNIVCINYVLFFCMLSPLFSTRLLFEDNDSGLFSVTLFRKAIDDFKHQARENK